LPTTPIRNALQAITHSQPPSQQSNLKQLIHILISFFLITSCGQMKMDQEQPAPAENQKLLGFKTMLLSELGDANYADLEEAVNQENIDINYLNDIIYVSYLEELNACGEYDGNIETKGDTITLNVELISDEVCTSTAIERITFFIDNTDGKVKMIKK